MMTTLTVGKRGTIVIPSAMREKLGLEEGTLIVTEEKDGGLLLRPAIPVPVEIYTPERKAEFLLSNAVDAEDYETMRGEVRKLGLDPDAIPHHRPF